MKHLISVSFKDSFMEMIKSNYTEVIVTFFCFILNTIKSKICSAHYFEGD